MNAIHSLSAFDLISGFELPPEGALRFIARAVPDPCPDVSYLEPDNDIGREGNAENARRLLRFRNGHWDMYSIRVTCSAHGVTLAQVSLGNVESDSSDEYFGETVSDLRAEALDSARTALAKLRAIPTHKEA